ncbi:MAG: MOSC domain-containing protein [Pseudomonadota bacterium]
MRVVAQVEAVATRGLVGDHRVDKTPGSGRQVTLISKEFIDQIALYLGLASVDPRLLRRNLVISGINLNALRYQSFLIGDAEFVAGALCHPCSRMETALGEGGVAAMLGHGGLCCEVMQGGFIRTGDSVRVSTAHRTVELFDTL